MLKRLSFGASVALVSLFLCTQGTAFAVLPGTHPNPTFSFKASAKKATSMAQQIASTARQQAESMSSVGFCYRGVKRALNSLGISLSGTAAWMAKAQLSEDERFIRVPFSKLRAGDILVHDKNRSHPYGHIAVYLGKGQEASDHVQKLVVGRTYGGTTVFRVKDAGSVSCDIADAPEPAVSAPQKKSISAAAAAKRVVRVAMKSPAVRKQRRGGNYRYAIAMHGRKRSARTSMIAYSRGGSTVKRRKRAVQMVAYHRGMSVRTRRYRNA